MLPRDRIWFAKFGRAAYTGHVDEKKPGMSSYAKAGAYAGLAFVTPISGWVCYQVGVWAGAHWNIAWAPQTGLIIGCVAGIYETFRQALRIEGLDAGARNKEQPR